MSLQQKLRHLQRSLDTSDISHLWERLDNSTYMASRQRRGLPEEVDALDALECILSHLPVRMGGLALLSHAVCAPLAAKVSHQHSHSFLTRLFPDLDIEPGTTSTQKQLCEEAFNGIQQTLFSRLEPLQRVGCMESGFYIGRRVLAIIPASALLPLTDTQVAAYFRIRLLMPEAQQVCTSCTRPSSLLHAESCPSRNRARSTRRHDAVKNSIFRALRTIPGSTFTVGILGGITEYGQVQKYEAKHVGAEYEAMSGHATERCPAVGEVPAQVAKSGRDCGRGARGSTCPGKAPVPP